MKKAEQLMDILTQGHTKVLPAKYAKVVLQVATLEERISSMMSFGLVDKANQLTAALIDLLQAVRDEYDKDNPKGKK